MTRFLFAIALLAMTFSVSAKFDPSQMVGFTPSNPGDVRVKFSQADNPKVVAEHGGFAVVNFGREDKCPSGGFYLVNLTRQTYQFIDAGSCAKNLSVTLIDPMYNQSVVTQILTFYIGELITARYPLYGY